MFATCMNECVMPLKEIMIMIMMINYNDMINIIPSHVCYWDGCAMPRWNFTDFMHRFELSLALTLFSRLSSLFL